MPFLPLTEQILSGFWARHYGGGCKSGKKYSYRHLEGHFAPNYWTLTGSHRWRAQSHKTAPTWDFPGGPVVKNPPSSARDSDSIPGGTKTVCCNY